MARGLVTAALAAAVWAAGASAATVTDRTLVCTAVTSGGIGFTANGAPAHGSENPAPASVSLGTTGLATALVAVSDGFGVLVSKSRCHATSTRVPLTRNGLPGRPTRYGVSIYCGGSRQVFVHVRASFDGKRLRSAAIGLRSYPANRPLAFLTLGGPKDFRAWSSGRCESRS